MSGTIQGMERLNTAVERLSFVLRFAAPLLALTTACAVEPPSTPAPPPVEKPAPLATVNGKPIFTRDLEAFLQFSGGEEEESDRGAQLVEMARQEALFQAAVQAGVQISEAETAGLLDEDARASVSPDFLDQVRRYLTVQKFIQQNIAAETGVSLGEMQSYYEMHADDFVVEDQLRIIEILVKDRSEAQSLRDALKPGDFRSFREAARRSSVGATAQSGGELGVFQKGQLPKRFEDFVFSLRVGEISAPFQSELGFHIFTIEERTPRHAQKFHEVQREIFARMVADRERDAVDRFVAGVLDQASIQIKDVKTTNWSKPDAQALQ